jgi:hypothetical protein
LVPLRNIILDCDIIIQSPGSPANSADCNMQCSGNIAEICGGLSRINIFSHSPPVQVDPPAAWSSLGCYRFVMHGISRCYRMSTHVQPFSDSAPSRTLPAAAYTSSGNMTTQLCCDFCATAGYKYAGVEYGIVSPFFWR